MNNINIIIYYIKMKYMNLSQNQNQNLEKNKLLLSQWFLN